jgi:hypothetical protein
MSSAIVQPESFKPAKLSVSPIKVLESGAKSAYVNYDGGKLIFQSAVEMSLPYGLNEFKDGAKADNPDYSIDVSFKGYDADGSVKNYYNALQEFDQFMLSEAYKNRATWFKNSNMSKEVIEAFYSPSIKVSRDKDGNPKPYPPTQKIKLRKMGGEFEAKIYDMGGKRLTEPISELLVKGVTVTAIVECGGLWFAGGKFGVTWRAKQIMIHKSPERLSDFAFNFGGGAGSAAAQPSNKMDDEKEDQLFKTMTSPSTPAANAFDDVDVPEDEEAEEVEPIPKPKPITKKKVTLGKK